MNVVTFPDLPNNASLTLHFVLAASGDDLRVYQASDALDTGYTPVDLTGSIMALQLRPSLDSPSVLIGYTSANNIAIAPGILGAFALTWGQADLTRVPYKVDGYSHNMIVTSSGVVRTVWKGVAYVTQGGVR